MSQEIRKEDGGERDINRVSNGNGERKSYEGFEGMNYEQIRQPFHPKYTNNNRSNEQRIDGKRPDEG